MKINKDTIKLSYEIVKLKAKSNFCSRLLEQIADEMLNISLEIDESIMLERQEDISEDIRALAAFMKEM